MSRIVSELMELSRLESAGRATSDEIVNVPALLAAARKAYLRPGAGPELEVHAESAAQLRGDEKGGNFAEHCTSPVRSARRDVH